MMKKFLLGVTMTLGVISVQAQVSGAVEKNVDGKKYYVHTVTAGQTLYQLSKEYKVEVGTIQQANNMESATLALGQELLIPKPEAPVILHQVEKGETLFGISRKYDMDVAEIKSLNDLQGDALALGQSLKVRDKSAIIEPYDRGPASDEQIVQQREDEKAKAEAAQKQPEKEATPEVVAEITPKEKATPEKEALEIPVPKEEAAPVQQKPGFHLVGDGETLYSIARLYKCEVKDLRKANKLDSESIRPGMELKVPEAKPGFAQTDRPIISSGSSLIEAMANISDADGEKDNDGEEFPELEILKVDENIAIAPEATQVKFTEKYSGKEFFKVEESGSAGKIDDLSTDQTKFYAFHKYLPKGSYIRVDYPGREQSILVEVVSQLPKTDPNIIRLSAKSRDYLMIDQEKVPVVLRYVVPVK